MKRIAHTWNYIKALLLCVLFVSCTAEDLADCIGEARVYFRLTDQSVNPATIDRIHLYVFNQNGFFVEEYTDNHISGFGPNYFIDIADLPAGNYRFIAWAGKDDALYTTTPAQFVKNATTINEAVLMLEHAGNILSTPIKHIFHADISGTLLIIPTPQHYYMPLTQLSNTINISTVGLPAFTDAFTFRITDNNCSYKFDRSFASHNHEPFTYIAHCTQDNAHQLHASLNVLGLSANRHTPQLQIVNESTGLPLYPVGDQSGDLIGLILSATPNVNFNTTHTFDIVLTFTGDQTTGFDVSVSVNGWLVNDENSELIE